MANKRSVLLWVAVMLGFWLCPRIALAEVSENFETGTLGGAWPSQWTLETTADTSFITTTAAFSTAGQLGRMTGTADSGGNEFLSAPGAALDSDQSVDIATSNALNYADLIARRGTAGNYYGCLVGMFNRLRFYKVVGGVYAQVGPTALVTPPAGVSSIGAINTWYRLRFKVTQNSNGTTTLQAKLWQGSEPSGWTLALATPDDEPTLQNVPGYSGMGGAAGHSTGQYIYLDNYALTTGSGVQCTSDADCPSGKVCGNDNGAHFGRAATDDVCWPPICVPPVPAASCGSVTAPCGTCDCGSVCATKACGDDPTDSCGGTCGGFCPDGHAGCQSDLECAPGSLCGFHVGTRFGFASDTNVCWPAGCASQAPQLGQPPLAGCGTPPACVPDCSGNRLEDGCGGFCINPVALQQRGPGGSVFTPIPMIPRGGNFFPDPLPQQATAGVGALQGTFEVSDQGTANYTIPIEVPPGRLGLQPNLALKYLGTKANGMLGLGWGLTGLSTITRCRSTEAQPPFTLRPVMLDDQDRFCLDGEMLIQVKVASGTPYGADGAQYVLEKDTTKLRITSHSEQGFTTGYFTALTRDGSTLSFGRNDAAVVALNGVRRVWALEDVEDSAHNFMTVRYLRVTVIGPPRDQGYSPSQTPTGELLPRLISYGGSRTSAGTAAARDATRSVYFDYDERPDPAHHYTAGDLGFSNWRIKMISTSVNGFLVKTYRVDYESPSADSPAPGAIHTSKKLHSVTECAPDFVAGAQVCKPATVFNYYAETLGLTYPLPSSWPIDGLSMIVLDANGDGRDDLAFPGVDTGVRRFLLSSWRGGNPGDAEFIPATDADDTIVLTTPSPAGVHFDQGSVIDLNRDGKDDLIPLGVQAPFRVYYSESTESEVHWRSELLPIPWDQKSWMFKLGDFDGDGLKDLVAARFTNPGLETSTEIFAAGFELAIYRNTGVSFESQPSDTFHAAALDNAAGSYGIAVFDYDLDGDDDLIQVGSGPLSVWDPATHSWKVLSDEVPFGAPVGDFNGDGLKDFMWPSDLSRNLGGANTSIRIWYNTGKGFKDQLVSLTDPSGAPASIFPWVPAVVADLDGDGADDIVVRPSSGGGRAVVRLIDRAQGQVILNPAGFPPLNPKEQATTADLDGDGSQEIVFVHSDTGELSFSTPGAGVANLLQSVQDGLGRRDTVAYAAEELHLHGDQPRTYTPDGCMGGNLTCLHRVAPLVSDHIEAQVDPATQAIKPGVETQFTYDGAVVESGRHGWFGFSHRIAEVVGLSTTITDYHTDEYLFAGLPIKQDVIRTNDASNYSSPGVHHDVTDYVWVSGRGQSADPDASSFPFLSLLTETRFADDRFYVRTQRQFFADTFNNVYRETARTFTPTALISLTTVDTPRFNDVYGHKIGLIDYIQTESQRGGDDVTRLTRFEYDSRGLVTAYTRQPEAAGTDAYQRTVLTPNDFGVSDSRCVITSDGIEKQRCKIIDLDDWSIYPTAITEAGEDLTTELTFGAEAGQLLVRTEPSGAMTEVAYDSFGRLSYVHGPTRQGPVGYSAASPQPTDFSDIKAWGALTVASQFAGEGFKSSTYDAFGHPVQSHTTGLDDTVVISEALYDDLGRLKTASLPHAAGSTNQGLRQYGYAANGLLRSVTEPDNSITNIEAINADNVLPLYDDWFGDLDAVEATVVELPGGNRKVYVRDHDGNIVRTFDDPNDLGGERLTTRFDHTAFDLVRDVTTLKDHSHFAFDVVGRPNGVSSTSTGARTRVFSGFDELVSETDANSYQVAYEYDSVGRVTNEKDSDQNIIAKWEYDGATGSGLGEPFRSFRRSTPTTTAGTWTEYEYETGTRARPVATTQRIGADLDTPESDGEVFRTSVSYKLNAPGQVDTLTYPSNGGTFKVQHDYDEGGNLRSIYPFGDASHPYWHLVAADQGLRAKDELFGNGVETLRGYHYLGDNDANCAQDPSLSCAPGLLASISTTKPDGSSLQQVGLGNDRNGNIRRLSESGAGAGAGVRSFRYDGLDRLTNESVLSAAGLATVKDYLYDPVGNLRYVTDQVGTTEYIFNPSNRRLDSFGDTIYSYDNNGNQTERLGSLVAGSHQHLDLNDFEMPWHISQGGSGTDHDIFLEYTADQDRILKREVLPGGDKLTTTIDDLYERVTTPNSTEHHYKIYGGLGQVAEITRHTANEAGTTTYLHGDHLGSTRLLTDAAGNRIEARDFEPFGKEKSPVDWNSTNIKSGFTGQSQDNDLGLVNMKGRLYDPAIGRFISADPFVSNPFSASGWDRYAYVENNPLSRIDPSGFDWGFADLNAREYGVNLGSTGSGGHNPGSRQGQGASSGGGHAPSSSGASGGAGSPQATGPSGPTSGPSGAGGPAMGQPAIAHPGNHPVAPQPTAQPTPPGQSNTTGDPAYWAADPGRGRDFHLALDLPKDPSGLSPEWTEDPSHKHPNGSRWRHPSGDYLDFHKAQPGKPGQRGKNHWHRNGAKKHLAPGTVVPDPSPMSVEPNQSDAPPSESPDPAAPGSDRGPLTILGDMLERILGGSLLLLDASPSGSPSPPTSK